MILSIVNLIRCYDAEREHLCGVIKITPKRYDENPDGAIPKTRVFAVGIWGVSTETRLVRSRYQPGRACRLQADGCYLTTCVNTGASPSMAVT